MNLAKARLLTNKEVPYAIVSRQHMKQLIVSADDFGLTESINAGILKAYKDGIVTSINLLPTGEAFLDAVNLIRKLQLDSIGAHLSLAETGRFHKNRNIFLLEFILGLIKESDIHTELENQLHKIERTGLKITNLSSHEYMHMMPRLFDIFLRLAEEHNIPFIRYPHGDKITRVFDINKIYKSFILSYLNKGMEEVLGRHTIRFAEHFLGFLDSGRLREDILIGMLKSLKAGTTELVCHPGFLSPEVLDRYRWHINCEEELFSVTSQRVKKLIKDKEIELIGYRELLSQAG